MTRPTRRTILAAAGTTMGLGALTGTTTWKRLTFDHVCEGDVTYKACVTGKIRKDNRADGGDRITHNGTCAEGGMGTGLGKDTYRYTGRLKRVRVNGPVKVIADGAVLHDPNCHDTKQNQQATTTPDCEQDQDQQDDGCGSETFCPFDNRLVVATAKQVHVEFATTGKIELPSGERVGECKASVSGRDGDRVEKEFPYSGEIRCLNVSGPGRAHVVQKAPCKEARN